MSLATVLLHGWLGCREDWDGPVLDRLRPHGPIVALDLPGHARPPAPYAPADGFAQGIERLWQQVDALGFDRCNLVGYSMGGRLAYAMAQAQPERVATLIGVGAHAGLTDADEIAARRRLDEERGREITAVGLPAFLDVWYSLPLWGPLREHPVYSALLARRCEGDPDGLGWASAALGLAAQGDLGPFLRAAPCPVLLVAGAHDRRYRDLNDDLASGSDAIQSVVIEDAWHAVLAQQPERLARTIEVFLIAADSLGKS